MTTPDNILAYNRAAWDAQVDLKNRWTLPVSDQEIENARTGDFSIVLTPKKPVPHEWFGELEDCHLLCLAGAGGQQAPILAAAGANVTVLDNSPKQLQQDQVVARRHGLSVNSVQGDMANLSAFEAETFDLIFHPCSNSFVPNVIPVWNESYRVMKPGGRILSGFCSPVMYIFDPLLQEKGELVVRHKLPFSEMRDLPADEVTAMRERREPFGFGHTLTDQIGGQLDAGLLLRAMYEDDWGDIFDDPLSKHITTFIATLAVRPETPSASC